MLSKLAYLTLRRSIQLLVLLARGDAAKDLEILVRHCCIEPECAGEAQQSGGSPSWQGAKKGSNHSTVPIICRLWAAKWRQSHGVIAQCNSAQPAADGRGPAGGRRAVARRHPTVRP